MSVFFFSSLSFVCCDVMLLFGAVCSVSLVLAQFGRTQRFRADPVLVSLLNGESVLYDAVAIVLFTSLEKHIDEASPALSDHGRPRAFCARVLWLILVWRYCGVHWSPGVTTKQNISVCSRITRSAPCASPHISRLPSHSSVFCVGSCPSSSLRSCSSITMCTTSRWTPRWRRRRPSRPLPICR